MENFIYYTPTKVVFGKDVEAETGALAKAFGAQKVLVHFGGQSAQKSGLLGRVVASLQAAGLACVQLGGVQPNPRLQLVRQGIQLCRNEGVDFIVAVGGGSVIDSAKAIAYGAANDGDVWDFYAGSRTAAACLPLGCVLTIAAAGSEMSASSVITNQDTGEKRGYNSDLCRPRFAVMNPELTMSLPAYHTAAGVADILMHTLERYFNTTEPKMELTDGIAEALLRNVMMNGRVLCRKPNSYEARAEMMWASSLSHNGLTGAGNGQGDWACHQLGHELSGRYDLAHGASLTAVWGSWARHVMPSDPERFAQLAVNVLELPDEGSAEEMALAGIEEMEGFFWAIEMPTSLKEAGIEASDEDIRQMAEGFSRGGTRTAGVILPLGTEDAIKIYTAARGK